MQQPSTNKDFLYGKTLNELETIVKSFGLPGFTARQISDWLYKKQAGTIDDMTNLSKKARTLLAENFEMGVTLPSKVQESKDGTKKYLFPAHSNLFIEAAYIPEEDRKTL